MRTPRRAAVALSAFALTGALAACGGDNTDDPAVDQQPGVTEPGVGTDPNAPGTELEPEPETTP